MADRPRIAHVGVAVSDLDAALAFYRDVLGLTPHPPEEADGATIVSLPFGDSEVELLAPRSADGPIAKFLERRGAGHPPHLLSRARSRRRARGLPRSRLSPG